MHDRSLYHRIISGRAGLWASPIRAALSVAASIYSAVVQRRNRRYDAKGCKEHLSVPVISVGNITVGGTGKTPLVIELARWFEAHGRSPVVVSRGYGSLDGQSNDEALVLQQQCPSVGTVCGADRIVAGKRAVREFGADVVILDDAFQHRRLGRDLDIVMIDATNPFGFEHVLPRGLLREPLSGLRRANLIVLSKCDQVAPTQIERIEKRLQHLAHDIPILRSRHRVTEIERLGGHAISSVADKRVVVFAAIGQPRSFVATVQSLGAQVVGEQFWPDHHHYRPKEIAALAKRGRFPSFDLLLTTEKDAVKLAGLDHAVASIIGVVKIAIDFPHEAATILESLLESTLARGDTRHDTSIQTNRSEQAEDLQHQQT